jgi:hypothetical protein
MLLSMTAVMSSRTCTIGKLARAVRPVLIISVFVRVIMVMVFDGVCDASSSRIDNIESHGSICCGTTGAI